MKPGCQIQLPFVDSRANRGLSPYSFQPKLPIDRLQDLWFPMSIRLLTAVNTAGPLDAAEASVGLVPLTTRAMTAQAGQTSLVASGAAGGVAIASDRHSWSSATKARRANWIDATPVEDTESEGTASIPEYVWGWSGSASVERSAIAQYLFYSATPAGRSGWFLNVYA